MLMVAFRSFRDYFASNVYQDLLNRSVRSSDYLLADWPAAAVACAVMMYISTIRDNRRALVAMHVMMIGGAAILGAVAVLYHLGQLSGMVTMTMIGIGLYIAWLPSQAIIIDRILSATHTAGTSVFLIFATDGLGYAGTLALLFYKSFGHISNVLTLFVWSSMGLAGTTIILSALSWAYFAAKLPRHSGYQQIN